MCNNAFHCIISKANDRDASLVCIVNPTNPTGDYWNVNEIKDYIEKNCERDTTVIVGEQFSAYHLELCCRLLNALISPSPLKNNNILTL